MTDHKHRFLAVRDNINKTNLIVDTRERGPLNAPSVIAIVCDLQSAQEIAENLNNESKS